MIESMNARRTSRRMILIVVTLIVICVVIIILEDLLADNVDKPSPHRPVDLNANKSNLNSESVSKTNKLLNTSQLNDIRSENLKTESKCWLYEQFRVVSQCESCPPIDNTSEQLIVCKDNGYRQRIECQSIDEVEDIHICGVCKGKFTDIDIFVNHKKTCKAKKNFDDNKSKSVTKISNAKKTKNSSRTTRSAISSDEVTEIAITFTGSTRFEEEGVQVYSEQSEPIEEQIISNSCISQTIEQSSESLHNKESVDSDVILSMMSSMGTKLLYSEVVTDKGKRFKCQFNQILCQFQTSYQKDLERHYRIHSGEKPFTCSFCGRSFNRSDKLKLHERCHTGEKPYKCDQCSYSSSDKSSLIKHQRIHTNDRPFKCQICQYASRSSSQLVVHLRTHTGDAPFRCSVCPAAFKINSDLKRHLTLHTGEKPFECDQCEYRTAIKGNLRVHHKLNHSTESQVKCAHCQFIAASKRALKEHIREHNTKSLCCDRCNYTTSSRSALNNHMRIHSEEKPYQCIVCGYCCRQSCNLRTHIRKKHPGFNPNSDTNKDISRYKKIRPNRKTKAKTYCQTIFPCELCDCSFVREDSLRSHVRHHKDIQKTTFVSQSFDNLDNQSNDEALEHIQQNEETIEQTVTQELELEVETSDRSAAKTNENLVAIESRLYQRLMEGSVDSSVDHSYMKSVVTRSGQLKRGRPQKKTIDESGQQDRSVQLLPSVSGSVVYQIPNSMRIVSYVPIAQTDTGDTLLVINSEALSSASETVITDVTEVCEQ